VLNFLGLKLDSCTTGLGMGRLGNRRKGTWGLFKWQKEPKKNFAHPSHRIFGRMYGALNISKKNNYLHNLSVNVETNLLSLVSP
jgi:hypothetical protein